jgi:uncharacterized protein (DUF1684 family)
MSEHLDLADWRRRMGAMYEALRRDVRAEPARLLGFRAAKDRLFASHPSSPVPLAGRREFRGLAYWRYAAGLALRARLEADPEAPPLDVPRSGSGPQMPYARIGWVSFEVDGTPARLAVYWLNEYAGGVFIPFRDATSGRETTAVVATSGIPGRERTSAPTATSSSSTSTTPTTRRASTTRSGAARLRRRRTG